MVFAFNPVLLAPAPVLYVWPGRVVKPSLYGAVAPQRERLALMPMGKHNQRHGSSNGRPQGRAPHNHNNQPWAARGLVTIQVPRTVAEAVRRNPQSPPLELVANGCYAWVTTGKALVVRKAPIADWRGHRDKILSAMQQGARKRVGALVEAMCQEGTVKISSIVLPDRLGPVKKQVQLRMDLLQPGDRWEIVTIHRHKEGGVWFRTDTPDGRAVEQRSWDHDYGRVVSNYHTYFPLISGVVGEDAQYADRVLQRLGAFCRMPLKIESFSNFWAYRCLKLSEYQEKHPTLVLEREAAVREIPGGDVMANDCLVEYATAMSGFSFPPHAKAPVIHTPEHVEDIATGRLTYVADIQTEVVPPERVEEVRMTSMEDLADAHRQEQEAEELEAALAKLREEQAGRSRRELAGVTAGRPALPTKARRAAELVRTAQASFQKAAPAGLPAGVSLRQAMAPLAPKPSGVPAWMSLPKRH